jgi:hypothetical protein
MLISWGIYVGQSTKVGVLSNLISRVAIFVGKCKKLCRKLRSFGNDALDLPNLMMVFSTIIKSTKLKNLPILFINLAASNTFSFWAAVETPQSFHSDAIS